MTDDPRISQLRDAASDVAGARAVLDTPQTLSPTYRLAFADTDFLMRDDMRGLRLQLEHDKTERALEEAGIRSTFVIFGSARVPSPEHPDMGSAAPLAHWYPVAQGLAQHVTTLSLARGGDCVVVTGGGPGLMEAGNRGAAEAGGRSIGLNIALPHEQAPNPYVTPDLSFSFHYFAIRKMHLLMRARAIAIFPGGFGTLDEMFEAITLIQTGRMARVPILLFDSAFWRRLIDWQAMVEVGTIRAEDLGLLSFVDTLDEAMALLDPALST